MFNLEGLPSNQLDFLRELENIGAGHAVTALSVMLGGNVELRVPKAQFCAYNQICDLLKGPENVVAGLLVGISEDLNGYILLVLDKPDAHMLTNMLLGELPDISGEEIANLSELQVSALKEVSNILIGSYLTAISALTDFHILASVPELVIDMAGAVMNLLVSAYGEYGEGVLFMETEFVISERSLFGRFFLIPDVDSYNKLMAQMGLI